MIARVGIRALAFSFDKLKNLKGDAEAAGEFGCPALEVENALLRHQLVALRRTVRRPQTLLRCSLPARATHGNLDGSQIHKRRGSDSRERRLAELNKPVVRRSIAACSAERERFSRSAVVPA
jgi:hypothetical protein